MPSPPRLNRRHIRQLLLALIALLRYMSDHLPARYTRYRPVLIALIALLTSIIAVVWYETAPEPGHAATAILADGRDVNVIVRDGRGAIAPVAYDATGHGVRLRPTRDWRTHTVGAAPALGWNPPYLPALIRRERGIYYCAAELAANPEARETMLSALRDVSATLIDMPLPVENCAGPDIILGLSPEQDCGSPLALGCAAYNGRVVRITARPNLPVAAVYWVTVHEVKHAFDLDHTGQYGGEGRGHGHCSDLGFLDLGVGGTNRPVDNPTGRPCPEDWHGSPLWRAPSPSPSPTPSPTPTPSPSPTPSPTPAPRGTMAQLWLHREDGARDCTIGGDGSWVVVTCALDAPGRYWHRLTPDGLAGVFEAEP